MPATIKSGSTGADVKQWQDLLTAKGYAPSDPPGTFGPSTHDQTVAWQAASGLVADGIAGPASWAKMTGFEQAHSYPLYYKDNAAFGRDILKKVWPLVTGAEATPAELQISGAQAHLESNYGKSSYKRLDHATGQTIESSGVINNWGAVQTNDAANGFMATDTGPSHVTGDNPKGYYDHLYRKYATPEEGAKSFVEHMTIKRPTSWALMKAGDIDAWAQQMWAGILPNGQLNKDPETGTFGYFEQKPEARAKGIVERVWAISDALSEPVAAGRGGPFAPSGDGGGDLVPDLSQAWSGTDTTTKGVAIAALAGLGYLAWRFLFKKG